MNIRHDEDGEVEPYDTGWEEPTDIFSFLDVLPGPDWPMAEDNNYNELLKTFDLKEVDLSNRDLSNLDFDNCDLRGANFSGCDLSRNSMRSADLRDVVFMNSRLDWENLVQARIAGAVFEGANIDGKLREEFEFDPHSESAPSFKGVIARKTELWGNMAGWDFSYADLTESVFHEADLSGANLEGATARHASFENAVMIGAYLLNACLEGANLARVDFQNAVLQGVDFTNADLTEVDVRNCDCRESLIERGRAFSAMVLDDATTITDVQRAVLTLGGAVFGEVRACARPSVRWNSVLQRLKKEDLQGVSLRFADMSKSDLSSANLSNADLSSAMLVSANLSDATLKSVDLNNAVLAGANLRNSYLADANLQGADLTHVDLTNAVLAPSNMSRTILVGSTLRKAKLAGADLRGADLSHANLEGATVNGDILKASSLKYTDLTGTWGLSESDLQRCLARGAVERRVEGSLDRTRPLSLGGKRGDKYFGLMVQGKTKKRESAALDAQGYLKRLDPGVRAALVTALGDEAVIGLNGVAEYRYLDQYGDLAIRLIIALREAGFVIVPND